MVLRLFPATEQMMAHILRDSLHAPFDKPINLVQELTYTTTTIVQHKVI